MLTDRRRNPSRRAFTVALLILSACSMAPRFPGRIPAFQSTAHLGIHAWDWDLPGSGFTTQQSIDAYDFLIAHSDFINVGSGTLGNGYFSKYAVKPSLILSTYGLDHQDEPYYHDNGLNDAFPTGPYQEQFYIHAKEATDIYAQTDGNWPLSEAAYVGVEWRVSGAHTAGDTTVAVTEGSYADNPEFTYQSGDIIRVPGSTVDHEVQSYAAGVLTISPGLAVDVADHVALRKHAHIFHVTACTAADANDCAESSRIQNISWGHPFWYYDMTNAAFKAWMKVWLIDNLVVAGGYDHLFMDNWGPSWGQTSQGFQQECADGTDQGISGDYSNNTDWDGNAYAHGGVPQRSPDANCVDMYDTSETLSGKQVNFASSGNKSVVLSGGNIREYGGTYNLAKIQTWNVAYMDSMVSWMEELRAYGRTKGVKATIANFGIDGARYDDPAKFLYGHPIMVAAGGFFSEQEWNAWNMSYSKFENIARFVREDTADDPGATVLLQNSANASWTWLDPSWNPLSEVRDTKNYTNGAIVTADMYRLEATNWGLAQLLREPAGSAGHVYWDFLYCLSGSTGSPPKGCDLSVATDRGTAADWQWQWLPMFDYPLGQPLDYMSIVQSGYVPDHAATPGPASTCTGAGTPFNCCTGAGVGATCRAPTTADGPCENNPYYAPYNVYRRDFENGIVLGRPMSGYAGKCGFGETRDGFDMRSVIPLNGVFKQVKQDGTFGTITSSATLNQAEAVLFAPATGTPALCADGIDNDSDGKMDYPQDDGCTSLSDTSE